MAPYTSPHHVGNPTLVFTRDKEMAIGPKDLSIVWGKDNRYWNWETASGTDDGVELSQVSWLEVTGCVDRTIAKKDYEVVFQLSLNQDAFGWGTTPIYIMVKRGKQGKFGWRKYNLESYRPQQKFEISVRLNAEKSGQSGSGSSSDEKLYFGMYEVWSGKWKGGLKIHGVLVKEVR
ncbi:protein PHLOEM PROTEIN 2-LIKE A9-like isoform X2 [Andrographis paniculata]|nr:protein PHLOEM PROTEIN 2-LIKE A9-like isoform X2 [Andrographis paniculata]